MNELIAQNGQFYFNGQPLLIQAGEFHYFRTPQDQWEHRLGLLKAAGFNTLATYIPWLWHQLDEGVSDFDGHSHPMRNLAGFLDLAAEMGMFIIARPGPYIMAETINEGIPPWVFQKYPQVAFVSQDQQAQNIASYLHPDFLACVKKWYQAIFSVLAPRQVTRGGKIIMVQLDNEMGMIAWVRNIIDTNPDTIARFAAYLRTACGQGLASRYPADPLEDFLREGITHPQQPYGQTILEDYRRFYRKYLQEYTTFLWSEAKSCGMEVLPVINIHGFMNGGKTFPIGISQLVEVIRIPGMLSATDVYPGFIGEGNFHQLLMVNEMTKAVQNQDQALFSIEFQAGGNQDFAGAQSSLYDLHSRLCISSGMRAINHYLFCDGENDPLLSPVKRHDWGHPVRKDGTLRKHYPRYAKLSRVLNAYGADLILSQPETVTTIGFLLDDFMTEVNNETTRESTQILTHQREQILFDFFAKGLSLTHRPFDALELSSGELDVSKRPLIWTMIEKQCDAPTQRKLVDYLHQGGRLVLVGRMCVEDFHHEACTLLKEALGITRIDGGLPFVYGSMRAFQHQDVPVSFVETYAGEFDEVFATSGNGEVTGFIQTVGRGKVLLLGAAITANTLEDLDILDQMAEKMGCPPLFHLSNWVDARPSCGDKGCFLFLNNYQDDPVETTVEYEKEDLFGGNPIHLPARRGLILPLEWLFRKNILVHYVTSEIVEIKEEGSWLTLYTEQPEFYAEMTLKDYSCDQATIIKESDGSKRVKVHGSEGTIVLRNEPG